ncbi:uncharacterized protein LOC112847035 [Oreochromis niloticus]|uniref:uncharacterized protein LOC112847035 n=1 Tax=Oreochromis niloticus TaxID=8128 RepID=UPI000DF215D5|nr:uncharacterized protein LOC112847035 [Oreochromis niloticus]
MLHSRHKINSHKVENDSTLLPTSTPFPSYNQNAHPQLIDNGASFPQNNAQPLHMNFPQQEDERYQHRVLPDNQPHPNSFHNNDSSTDLVKFLAKSQLVSSGLTKFDDLPEHYKAWRETLINTIESLSLSASEEMVLLIKWLGKESGEHAIRIRSVSIRQPNVGLRMIWERLNKKYGAPEVIERALFCKLESFPKIHNRESQKLQELADLLTELDVAKREGYVPGLAYLDTSRGVQPIVEKLPLYLKDKWLSHGCKYKRDHHVAFPPFSYFKEFICREAEERNDPSFNYPDLFTNSYRKEKSSQVK